MPKPLAVLGCFDDVNAFMQAIPKVKTKGLGRLEAYTPYPIHGLDEALGLRRSPLGGMVLVMGVIGALTALGFQYWISAIDYPIVTGGKAPWSWEAFIPIMFEVTVLFATFTAGLGMLLLLNKLPFWGHPVLGAKAIKGITRDRFVLAVEADAELDEAAARAALSEAGAEDLEVLEQPEHSPMLSSAFILKTLAGIGLACLVAGLGMYSLIKLYPTLRPMVDMQDQPKVNAQQGSAFFADGRAMRLPVTGTVARGHLPLGVKSQDEAASLVNPLPRTPTTLDLGRKVFMDRCAVCHGPLGNGQGSLTAAYGAKPANFHTQQFRDTKDGQIYWVVVNGKNAMPGHAADLTEDQRWAVVHHVRALQRAQNAKDEDLR